MPSGRGSWSGRLGLDLAESIDGFQEIVAWSKKQSEDYAEQFAKNAGDPPLVIGGIEMVREIEPKVMRAGIGVPLPFCEEGK